jgi:PII-like signaling protein
MSVSIHPKKRLELIIERPAYRRASRILEEAGVTGYTAFSAMGGLGGGIRWQRGTDISASRDMVMIVSVMDEEIVERAIENLKNLVGMHIGILNIADVGVIRDDNF